MTYTLNIGHAEVASRQRRSPPLAYISKLDSKKEPSQSILGVSPYLVVYNINTQVVNKRFESLSIPDYPQIEAISF